MATKRKEFRLPEDVAEIIEQTKIENGFSTDTETLISIVRSHAEKDNRLLSDADKNDIADLVVGKFHEKYKKTYDRIRLASTFSERYSYLLLDAINTMLYETKASFLMPASGEQQHIVIRQSLDRYKEIIERNKQVKDNENLKRG